MPGNPTILEAGGYDGEETFLMSQFWPNGIVNSFEPVPENFNKLKARTESQKNVFCYRLDFMWLDMQGYELNMLKHAQNILKNARITHTEVEFVEAYKNKPLFVDVKEWLES